MGTFPPMDTGWWFQTLSKILVNRDDYSEYMGMGQNPLPLVNIPEMNRIVFMGMFTYPILMVIGVNPWPYSHIVIRFLSGSEVPFIRITVNGCVDG